MALSEIDKYQRKLKRLIENVPQGYKVCYDASVCALYVVSKDAAFFDTENWSVSVNYPGGGCPFGATSGMTNADTGNDRDEIVGDFIEVNMEAAQR
jgi:hypothetical protein